MNDSQGSLGILRYDLGAHKMSYTFAMQFSLRRKKSFNLRLHSACNFKKFWEFYFQIIYGMKHDFRLTKPVLE